MFPLENRAARLKVLAFDFGGRDLLEHAHGAGHFIEELNLPRAILFDDGCWSAFSEIGAFAPKTLLAFSATASASHKTQDRVPHSQLGKHIKHGIRLLCMKDIVAPQFRPGCKLSLQLLPLPRLSLKVAGS